MSAKGNICPFCKGTGTVPKNLLSNRSIDFLRDLFETQEIEAFLSWAELKWLSEPDRTVTQAVHRELEIIREAIGRDFQEVLEARDEKHQEWLQGFIEKADLKEEAKQNLISEFKKQWNDHVEESRNSHSDSSKQLTKVLEKLELSKNIPARGFKFEDMAIEELEKEFPYWEFEQTQDSRIGDCTAKPKVMNSNGEYEPTNFSILLEFTTEQHVGTKKIRQLTSNMKRRNATFGVIITEKAEQITAKYYPYRVEEGRIAVVPFELHKVALSTFEAIITALHANRRKAEEVNWEKVKSVINEVVEEETGLVRDIIAIGNNLITYSKTLSTKLTNRLSEHTRKATDRLRNEILEGGNQ